MLARHGERHRTEHAGWLGAAVQAEAPQIQETGTFRSLLRNPLARNSQSVEFVCHGGIGDIVSLIKVHEIKVKRRPQGVQLLSLSVLQSRSGGGDGFLLAAGSSGDPLFGFEWCQCAVDVGAGIAFDAAADAVQLEVEGGELGVGFDDFTDTPDVEDEGVFAG